MRRVIYASESTAEWNQSQPGARSHGVSWANQYDAADQLTAATISDQVTSAMLTNNAFAYDRVENRLSKQQNSSVVGGTFNNLNQLTSLTGGNGRLQVSGSISKTSKVTIQSGTNSYPATTLWGTNFAANIPAMLGSNTFSVVAQDANTNLVTNTYQIDVTALEESKSFIYDANGNCLSDGQRSYQWDAANRLASVTQGTNTYAFGYDFAGRRISEKLNGTLIKQSVWDSAGNSPTPLEERSASNTVTKRFYAQGQQQDGTNYFYLRDHLGSVREMVNASGSIVSEATYEPYGVATVSGTVIPTFQYAGYYAHQGSGLNLTWYRSYDPVIGRWLSRDPIGEAGGINLYGYVANNPINLWDPLGLSACDDYVDSLVGEWGKHSDGKSLGDSLYKNRTDTLRASDGFKPGLTMGGQGGAVSRHINGNAGAALQGRTYLSYGQEARDWAEGMYQPGKSAEEAGAEILGDRAGREVAGAMKNAYKSGKCKEESGNSLRDQLKKILCNQ